MRHGVRSTGEQLRQDVAVALQDFRHRRELFVYQAGTAAAVAGTRASRTFATVGGLCAIDGSRRSVSRSVGSAVSNRIPQFLAPCVGFQGLPASISTISTVDVSANDPRILPGSFLSVDRTNPNHVFGNKQLEIGVEVQFYSSPRGFQNSTDRRQKTPSRTLQSAGGARGEMRDADSVAPVDETANHHTNPWACSGFCPSRCSVPEKSKARLPARGECPLLQHYFAVILVNHVLAIGTSGQTQLDPNPNASPIFNRLRAFRKQNSARKGQPRPITEWDCTSGFARWCHS